MALRPRSDNVLRDELTGVYSRASLNARLHEEIERARHYQHSFSLLLLDVDHFKSVNDAFGHSQGDRVLNEFARRLMDFSRSTDIVCRYGGDEFLILMPYTDRAQAVTVAQHLLDRTASQPFASEPPLTLTMSIGVATFPADGQTPETLFEVSDRRHYQAKRTGRARVVSEDPPPSVRLEILPEEPPRLIERDQVLESLYKFLDALPEKKRGMLTVNGPVGSGRTRFLDEARKIARLRGYLVLTLKGTPALKNRIYGALDLARRDWKGLPSPVEGETAFINAIVQLVNHKAHTGLLVTIDNLADIDRATLDFLRNLFLSLALPLMGLVYANEATEDPGNSATALWVLPSELSLREAVTLEPISVSGMRIWVRHALHWEASPEFLEWLEGETAGLPALIQNGLKYIIEEEIIKSSPNGLTCRADFNLTRLGRLLARRGLPPPHNLPTGLTPFVGREDELYQLNQVLADHSLVTILGPDGLGKTRLAIQAAYESRDAFTDGVYFISLSPLKKADMLAAHLAEAVQCPSTGSREVSVRLFNYLSQKNALLVLDSFEHVRESASLLEALLNHASRIKILATSRERMGLSTETVFEPQGLPFPKSDSVGREENYSAVQLFVHSAQRIRYDFTLTEADKLHVARICRLVGGMPLGIEFAAAWVQTFTCQEIADKIEHSLASLADGSTDGGKQYRNLLAVFDSFWNLLSFYEQGVLSKLATFSGEFTADMAQQSAGASPFFLDALSARSFLHRTPQGHYEIHELLRQYVSRRM